MSAWVPAFRPRASALHAAAPGPALAFCAALALAAVLFEHPLLLAAVAAAVVVAAAGAGVGAELRRAARLAVPLALLVTAINPLVSNRGDTVLVRGWTVLTHRFDITLEAIAYGGVAGLRVLALGLAAGLFAAVVDPDDTLRLFRRVSYRSALTAALATRLVPLLARDATRLGDAARCRAQPPPRAAVAKAALAGALERAVDAAAALELRGYAAAARPARSRPGRRWSRHRRRVAAAAAALTLAAVAARVAGLGAFAAYPRLEIALGPGEIVAALALVALAGWPAAGAVARLGVARA